MLGYSARGSGILNIQVMGFGDSGDGKQHPGAERHFQMNGSRTPRPADWPSLRTINLQERTKTTAAAQDEGEAIGSLVWTLCLRGSC